MRCAPTLAELGIVAAQGYDGLKTLLLISRRRKRRPFTREMARACLSGRVAQIAACQAEISAIEKRLLAQHPQMNEDSKRLETIPGIGIIGASAIVATVPDASVFKTGRDFAAWIPVSSYAKSSTGGKKLAGAHLRKQGNRYLRRILILGALSVVKRARCCPENYPWLTGTVQTGEGGGSRAGKQNGAYRLGGADQERYLPRAANYGSADSCLSIAFSNCRGDDDVMRNGRAVRSGKPTKCHARKERAALIGT